MQQVNTNSTPYNYLFYVTLSYGFSILRPVEKVLKESGHNVAWFIPTGDEAEQFLLPGERVFGPRVRTSTTLMSSNR